MSDCDSHDCPLCMEAFEIDDLHFYPCTCGYQICRFCWHRIRTDGNGLCPACRKTYTEDPAMYRALSHDEIQKVKKERKQKEAQHKQKISDNRQHLSNIRVIQRHLVFVVGLSNKMADIEVLKRPEYFGSYGKIVKIVINPNTNYAGPQGPSASAYITYTKEDDALKAILSINEMQPPLKIRASLGTTKYCTHYLRNMVCPKVDCMYLHDVGEPEASFTKEDMQAGKHQLFEKNLLDNYMKKEQEKQLESQDSYEDYDGSDQLDSNSQEDWGEESDTSNDKSLPSKASWGTSKEDKNINTYMNEPSPTDYPVLEARKPSPKQIIETPVVSSSPPPTEINRSAAPPMSTAKPVPVPIAVKPLPKPTNQKEGVLNPGFSTGWATSFEAPILDSNVIPETMNTTTNNNNNNNFMWPTTSDLGLSDLKINPSDDDLGFDPFNESKSGLEDLMATEKQLGSEKPAAPQPSFSWDAFWPSNYGSSQNQLPLMNSYSLFGASQPMSNPHMSQYRPPPPSMNQYPISPMNPGSNPLNMVRFSNPHQSQHQRFPIQLPNTNPAQNKPPMPQQPFMNQYQFPPSPSQGPPPHIPTPAPPAASASSGGISTDNKNWQDGLRALLPNINISFSNQQLEKKLSEKWTSNETPVKATPASEVEKGNISSPPPGFKSFTNVGGGEVKQPWMAASDKAGPRPPPPPGFGKPSEPFPGHSQQPGLLNTPSGIHSTPVPNNFSSSSQSSSQSASTSQGSHEDPSILWSKVLKDVPKEIENNEIAFPLPGENLKAGSSLDSNRGVPPMVAPSSLTSWNTIVSGNQSGKGPKSDDSSLKSTMQILTKESSESIPTKSPIFGNQQNQSIKQKPTATVKPLKCNPTLDGFTTVQNSRQMSSQPIAIATSTASTGSRVSELDDFSADLPVDMPNNMNNLSEYPMVAASLMNKSTTKKKKRKGKDQIEQITEITVGQVESERPPIPIIDDLDRPKKNGKAKKKAGMKVSPPAQRKSPPPKAKEQTQPIRILKSDGNGATTTFSPAQVAADNGEVSKTVNSGNHDHEIVSRLTESTEKLLKNVLFETEAIKLNTEQISKDLKSALEKCKESSLSLSDLEKINLLLTPGKLPLGDLDDPDMVDTYDLERQVESARREAKMLEARLNDVIRKNMASELETLKRNTKNSPQ